MHQDKEEMKTEAEEEKDGQRGDENQEDAHNERGKKYITPKMQKKQ